MPRVKHEAETAGLAPDVLPLALLLPLRFLIGRLSKRTHRQRQHPAPAFRIKADVAGKKISILPFSEQYWTSDLGIRTLFCRFNKSEKPKEAHTPTVT